MSHFTVLVIGENPEDQLAPFQENNMGDCPKEFMEFHEDDEYEIDEDTGKKGYWFNPNSKWDWYSLGGRWSGMIKLKQGKTGVAGRSGVFGNEVGIDQAFKKDIDNINEIKTFAIIKDGKWYERGEMGWWGIVSNEKNDSEWDEQYSKLLNSISKDSLISIFDCHI